MKIKIKNIPLLVAILFSLFSIAKEYAQIPAFPGAEGYGATASGGRGGVVFEVTTLDDDAVSPPAGSLRAALKDTTTKPRTIVFRVSGIIELKGRLDVGQQNITIAGQTAPGDGICLKNYPMKVYGKNIIIRYIHFRPGDLTHSNSPAIYGIDCENARNVIVDHCSVSWAIEENATFYDNKYTTFQWSIISESLKNSYNTKGAHGYAGVWGGQYASYHHNLIAHNDSRNPRFNGARAHDTIAVVDFRNNVIYNWASNSAYGGEIEIKNGISNINMVANYYKYGPATSSSKKNRIINPSDTAFISKPGVMSKWYIADNYVDGYPAITADNWSGGVQPQDSRYGGAAAFKADSPFQTAAVNTQKAEDAYADVLKYAGASFPMRDTIDLRIVTNAKYRTAGAKNGIIDSQTDVNGWCAYNNATPPVDSDHDGMPDSWEIANGLNPNDPLDGVKTDSQGYTMLENYLNSLVSYQFPLAVNETHTMVADEYRLYNNYPNPFNPETTITYYIPKTSAVHIVIYNLLGQQVEELVNTVENPGRHSIAFSGRNLSSGIYFCYLKAASVDGTKAFTDANKLILLK